MRPAARRPLSSAAAATPLRVPRRVPPSLVRTHAPTKPATAPAVRPAARRPLSSAVASTPLRVPRRLPPSPVPARTDLSSSRAGREASSAPPAFVGRRRDPPIQGAAASASLLWYPHAGAMDARSSSPHQPSSIRRPARRPSSSPRPPQQLRGTPPACQLAPTAATPRAGLL